MTKRSGDRTPPQENLGFLCLPPAPSPVRLVSGGLRAMAARWISALAGRTAPFLDVSSTFVRVCVLLIKTRRRRLPEDGIRFSLPSPRSGGVSINGGRMEVCLRRIYPWWICWDLVVVRLPLCFFRLDPSDLCYSSSGMVAVLLQWSYGTLARRLPDCLLQQVLPGSSEGGAMTATRLQLASVLVVVTRWFMDLYVIFIISDVHCIAMIEVE